MLNDCKIAVVGCGYWGKNLVRNFHQLGALQMVCDLTDAGRKLARELAPGIPVVDTVEQTLDANVDAVVFATPAETHYTLAMQTLLAGKDVFVEKPLALTYEQGEALVHEASRRRRILMVGHVLEYHPGIVELTKLVHSGALGKIRYIYSNRLSLGKVRREENILWSFAPHDIAVILRLMSDIPFQVSACGGAYVQANIADVTITNMLFDNGVRAHIYVSWLHPFKEQRLVVVGSKAMVSFDDVTKRLQWYDQRVEWQEGQPVPVKNGGRDIPFPNEEPLKLECQAFLKAIRSRTPPITDGSSGLAVLKVLQASQRSLMLNGDPVSLPVDVNSSYSTKDKS